MSNNENIVDNQPVSWLSENGKIMEEEFCKVFTETIHPLLCINGIFIDRNGIIEDESIIQNEVATMLCEHIKTGVPRRIKDIMEMLRIYCRHDPLPIYEDRILLKNGTLFLDGRFVEEKDFCMNRLPINYNTEAKTMPVWLKFINDLFYPEDIPTVQEYLGNLLIPSTRSQKMMLIKGDGGEGKSRIGIVLKKIMGANMYSGALPSLEKSPYSRGQLEFRLLFLDDDLMLSALPETNNIKTIVTAEAEIDVERKYVQNYQTRIYSRLLAFGNGNLRSLYDKSKGFFRRQLIIQTKPVPEGRENDPYLADKLCEEAEQIFWWMFAGLKRLIANNFQYTISERTERNLSEAMREGTNYEDFAESEGYIEYVPGAKITTEELFEIYKLWCKENASKVGSYNSLSGYFKDNKTKYDIQDSNHIKNCHNRYARGFIGIKACIEPKQYCY